MEVINLLHLSSRSELRQWLEENHNKEKCCWVEEALCFGWIDSTLKRLPDGRLAQRLSPRRAKSHWTQLNMDRCVDLEDRGLMTEAGRQAFEKAFEYEIVSPDSEISKRMQEENKLKRPGMYE